LQYLGGATAEKSNGRDGAILGFPASATLAHQRNEICSCVQLFEGSNDDKQRDTTYTRQIPTRYVCTAQRGATVNDHNIESADRIFLAAPICASANLEYWLIPQLSQMGAHKYLEELQKKKQSDVMRFLLRVRCWEVRHTDT
jgi:hypothetical protein